MIRTSGTAKKQVRTSPAKRASKRKYTVMRMQFRGATITLSEARKAFRTLHAQNP